MPGGRILLETLNFEYNNDGSYTCTCKIIQNKVLYELKFVTRHCGLITESSGSWGRESETYLKIPAIPVNDEVCTLIKLK